MDIRQALLKRHSKAECEKIVKYIGRDEKKFARLMSLFAGEEYKVTQWAGWPLSICVQKHPGLVAEYFPVLIELLERPGTHEAVPRNITRLLQFVKIPEKFHGKIMTACFDFITSETTPVAVKAFSLSILDNLSKEYPEIVPELKLVIEERWEHETAAFRSRGRKILNRLS